MTKRRKTVIIAISVAVLAAGYAVGWHTWIGLALRGTCKLYVRNASETPLRNFQIPIANSLQPSFTSRIDIIQPHQRVRVTVPKSHIYIGEIVWEQGPRTNVFYETPGLKVRMGETLELVVDSDGKISARDQ